MQTAENPAASPSGLPVGARFQTRSGPRRLPVGLRLGMLPPTVVTHGESSQTPVARLVVIWPGVHGPLTARCCAASQSPLPTSTGIPFAAAVS